MRFFLDTEFIETPPNGRTPGSIELLSIGVVDENDREFYAINGEADHSKANNWVKANVLPHLDPSLTWLRRRAIGAALQEFVGDEQPEFWAYFADYDWVATCWLFGAMLDLPKGWPMFCRDLKQTLVEHRIGRDFLPPQPKIPHHALHDARWLRDAHHKVMNWINAQG